MSDNQQPQRKYFSFANNENKISESDLEVLESDSTREKKLKEFIKENFIKNNNQIGQEEAIKEEKQLKDQLMDFIDSGEIDKEVLLEAISHGVAEMIDFAHHEPQQNASFSSKEKEGLHNMMIDIIKKTESEEHVNLCESIFPELIKNLELTIAKIRTPRF